MDYATQPAGIIGLPVINTGIPNVFDGIMGHRDLMSDPIHPNGKGYTIMARHFYEAIRPYLHLMVGGVSPDGLSGRH